MNIKEIKIQIALGTFNAYSLSQKEIEQIDESKILEHVYEILISPRTEGTRYFIRTNQLMGFYNNIYSSTRLQKIMLKDFPIKTRTLHYDGRLLSGIYTYEYK